MKGGDFHFPYSVAFIPWALFSFWLCTCYPVFCWKNEWTLLLRSTPSTYVWHNIYLFRYISLTGWNCLLLEDNTLFIMVKLWVQLIKWKELVCQPCWILCPKRFRKVLLHICRSVSKSINLSIYLYFTHTILTFLFLVFRRTESQLD